MRKQPMARYPRWARVLTNIAAIGLIGAWFSYGILENTFVGAPQQPDMATGHTVPYEAKGVHVFLTPGEWQLMWWLSRVDAVGFGIMISGMLMFEFVRRTRPNLT
jgi:hypothetical protein